MTLAYVAYSIYCLGWKERNTNGWIEFGIISGVFTGWLFIGAFVIPYAVYPEQCTKVLQMVFTEHVFSESFAALERYQALFFQTQG